MSRIALAIAAVLLLAGCHTTSMTWDQVKALRAQEDAQCQKSGEKPGTQGYADCRKFLADQEANRIVEARARRRAIGAGLVAMSESMQAYQAAHRPITCTSNRMGTFTQTNCY